MNVLFLTHRLPYSPNRGDRIRAYHLMKAMAQFSSVTLFSLVHDDEEARHARDVPFATSVVTGRARKIRNTIVGASRLGTERPLTHSLLDASEAHSRLDAIVRERRPDVVFAFCSGMARFALEPPLNQIPLVVDLVDVDSEKWRDLAPSTAWPLRWVYEREGRTLSKFEARMARIAKKTFVVNERERQLLASVAPDADVLVLENGVDLEKFRPSGPPAQKPIVVFCGVLNYYPNVDGVLWFANEVWPRVRAARNDAELVLVGSSPTTEIRRLGERDPSIRVVGQVPRVEPFLHEAAVSVAPLRIARGVQTKVIEALAAGLPVVATSVVNGGLPSETRPGILVADGPAEQSDAINQLLSLAPERRRALANACRLEAMSWQNRLSGLEEVLRRAASGAD